MDYSNIVIAILSLAGTLFGSFIANTKTQALLEYRLTSLETKVDKHNRVIERTYELEKHRAVVDEKLREIGERLGDLEDKNA